MQNVIFKKKKKVCKVAQKLPQKCVQFMRNLTRVMVTHFNRGSNQLDFYYFSSSSQRVGYHTCVHISNNPDLFLYVKTKFEEFILVKEISQRDNFQQNIS